MSEPITDVSAEKWRRAAFKSQIGSGSLQCQSHRRVLCSGLERSKLSERRGAGADRGTIELFKELTQLKILLYSACSQLDDFCASGVFWCAFFFMSFGAWRSYQTGIHHKSTPSPELRQLLAAQCYGEAGEQSARHQVEQGGLAHLHHCQRHEGDEQTDAVRYHEREGQETREALLTMQISTWISCWSKRKITLI